MPNNLVSTKRQERLWAQAERIAEDEGKGGNYAYITGIYKKSLGEVRQPKAKAHGYHPRSSQKRLRTGR